MRSEVNHRPSVTPWNKRMFWMCMRCALVVMGCSPVVGCSSEEGCKGPQDCDDGSVCELETGRCVRSECRVAADCEADHACHVRTCVPRKAPPLTCPEDMANVDDVFCMDRYEASRPDASETHPGSDTSRAQSRAGVVPWEVANNQEAQAACTAAGKDLCTPLQWQAACEGPQTTVYAYGDDYDPEVCNGIDRFCHCGAYSPCADEDVCPFPGCFSRCGASFRVLPTGNSSECRGPHGIFDLNGNLWEHVKGGNDMQVRGGAYNCRDSQDLHRCAYVPSTWTPAALGFRCCSTPSE